MRFAVDHRGAGDHRAERQMLCDGLGDRVVGHGDQRLRDAGFGECMRQLERAGHPWHGRAQARSHSFDQVVNNLCRRQVGAEPCLDDRAGVRQSQPDERQPVLAGPFDAVLGRQTAFGVHPDRTGVDQCPVEVPEHGAPHARKGTGGAERLSPPGCSRDSGPASARLPSASSPSVRRSPPPGPGRAGRPRSTATADARSTIRSPQRPATSPSIR